jgi:hypothetical protein
METDFIEHAAEINEAADFGVTTAETGNVRHGGIIRSRSLLAITGFDSQNATPWRSQSLLESADRRRDDGL